MDLWGVMLASCQQELNKLAGINLNGVNHEAVEANAAPPPLETPGMSKALAILQRAEAIRAEMEATKVAGATEEAEKTQDKYIRVVRPYARAGFTGMGTGTALASLLAFKQGKKIGLKASFGGKGSGRKIQATGAALGLSGGLADRHYTDKKLHQAAFAEKEKKSTITDPAAALKASQKIGRFGRVATTNTMGKPGPTIKQTVPLIGRKGTLPTIGGK